MSAKQAAKARRGNAAIFIIQVMATGTVRLEDRAAAPDWRIRRASRCRRLLHFFISCGCGCSVGADVRARAAMRAPPTRNIRGDILDLVAAKRAAPARAPAWHGRAV